MPAQQRTTPLRHYPYERRSTPRSSPADNARITTFGFRDQSVSPIPPVRTSSFLSPGSTNSNNNNNNTIASTSDFPNLSGLHYLHSGGGLSQTSQNSRLIHSRSFIFDQNDNNTINSSYIKNDDSLLKHEDSIIMKHQARQQLLITNTSGVFNQPPTTKQSRTVVEKLRMLRQDAQQQYLPQASIFFAEKVMAITSMCIFNFYCLLFLKKIAIKIR